MEDASFYGGRYEVLLEQIRDALWENANRSGRIANALEKLNGCIGADGRLRLNIVEKKEPSERKT